MNRNESISPQLGLWDAVSVIVGIVVGTAIFRSTTVVFQNVTGPWPTLGVWLLGGVLSLCGAFCYAELATRYPRDGGDYEYLSRAYGRSVGFLFGWAQLTVVLSGCIGAMAYAFADYGAHVWPSWEQHAAELAAGAVVVLSLGNALGIAAGKTVQNVLSAAKVAGLAAVVGAALWAGASHDVPMPPAADVAPPSFGLAMVFVLWAYGGWNNAAFVAAEVRDQRRNLPWALILGIAGITVIYLAVNAAYLSVLGFDGARQTLTPAADVLDRAIGPWSGNAISVLVMISALGAINGMILTGSRIYATLGADFPGARWLAAWNRTLAAPLTAIAVQGLASIVLILIVGTERGRAALDAALRLAAIDGLPWDQYAGGFETLVAGSAPVFWAFFLLSGVSVFVLRFKDRSKSHPFLIPWYPLPPIVFCATCGYMLYASLEYARWLTLLGAVPLALGWPVYYFTRRPNELEV